MLSQLREIVEQVARIDDVRSALNLLVQKVCHAMAIDCCSVYLVNDKDQRLDLMAVQGLCCQDGLFSIGFDQGLVGWVKRSATLLNIAKASEHPCFKYFPRLNDHALQSFLGVPIIHRKKVLGVLVVQQKAARCFNELEESFLVTLAMQIANTIDQAAVQGLFNSVPNMSIKGSVVSSGIAIGKLWAAQSHPRLADVLPASCLDVDKEKEWLLQAIESAQSDFQRMRKKFDKDLNTDQLAIFDFFAHLLNDPMLRSDLMSHIEARCRADWALKKVVESYAERFASMDNDYLQEKAQDIKELGQKLLFFLHNAGGAIEQVNDKVILVVNELSVSLLASVPKEYLLAVIALDGTVNSHAAILSRALGIPTLIGVKLSASSASTRVAVVDGYSGDVFVSPSPQIFKIYSQLAREEKQLLRIVNETINQPAISLDGVKVDILLNTGLVIDNPFNLEHSVDGVGLYRSEISFLLQSCFPSEEEQCERYKALLKSFANKTVVMRTLDVGGDKPLSYLPIEEDNPFLGWRGIRFSLDHPDMFVMQIRAMIRAHCQYGNLSLLLPMVSSIGELDEALKLIHHAFYQVSATEPKAVMPKIGIMIEVPSMIYLLSSLVGKIDFVSVGTNDLTQYLLAVDRNNPRVAEIYASRHPSILRALKQIEQACRLYKLPVCVCGELAGEPVGAMLLVGLGYRSLSMDASNVGKIKYLIRRVSTEQLAQVSEVALAKEYGQEIESLMQHFFDEQELSHFIQSSYAEVGE